MLLAHLLFFAVIISTIDIRTRRIPRRWVYVGLLSLMLFFGYEITGLSLVNFLIYLIIFLISGGSLGMGDLRLSLLIGAYFGALGMDIQSLLYLNFLSWCGAFFYLLLKNFIRSSSRPSSIPFSPFMFLAPFSAQFLA